MCQLLGMNANSPTDIVFSFAGFRKRGGLTDHHEDGFGIAFFEDGAVRLLQDNRASAHSVVGDWVHQYPIKSTNILAHIRKATTGRQSLVNTHPFMRELWGEYWVFAHNGQLEGFCYQGDLYQSVGDTDSEAAFCFLLDELKRKFPQKPDNDTLFAAINQICLYLSDFGMFNCLLSNGQWLLAYASTLLHHITRAAPFGVAELVDCEQAIDFRTCAQAEDVVTVLTTLPLTENETWQQMHTRECLVFANGRAVYQNRQADDYLMDIAEGLRIARSYGASA